MKYKQLQLNKNYVNAQLILIGKYSYMFRLPHSAIIRPY